MRAASKLQIAITALCMLQVISISRIERLKVAQSLEQLVSQYNLIEAKRQRSSKTLKEKFLTELNRVSTQVEQLEKSLQHLQSQDSLQDLEARISRHLTHQVASIRSNWHRHLARNDSPYQQVKANSAGYRKFFIFVVLVFCLCTIYLFYLNNEVSKKYGISVVEGTPFKRSRSSSGLLWFFHDLDFCSLWKASFLNLCKRKSQIVNGKHEKFWIWNSDEASKKEEFGLNFFLRIDSSMDVKLTHS